MLVMRSLWLLVLALSLAAPRLAAQGALRFEPLFDGATLAGWSGDARYWSVEDGVIVGRSTAEVPCKRNTFLVHDGTFGDFELRFSYRILGETGPTRETITVRRTRGGTVLKRLVTKATVKSASTMNALVWRVPARLPYGAYVWCLTSRDALGNTSTLQCAPFTV